MSTTAAARTSQGSAPSLRDRLKDPSLYATAATSTAPGSARRRAPSPTRSTAWNWQKCRRSARTKRPRRSKPPSARFRPGRNCLHALNRVEELLTNGYTWIVDVDLKSYLDPYSYYTFAVGGWSKSCG